MENNAMKEFKPTNFSRSQIESLAKIFAEKTSYIPGHSDIFNYIKALGGEIEYTDEPTDSNGGSIEVSGPNSFVIKLSKTTSSKRDIFTIAHELGHYVLHSKLGTIQIHAGRVADIDTAEREANSFAASFLMPAELVKEEFEKSGKNLIALSEKFNVSISAMTWRCRNLGLTENDK